MTADTSAPSLREALERIHARAIADDDADEKELRRQLYHIEALVKDAMTKLALLPDAATIRAAAFEEAAKIAEDDERQDEWPKSVDVTRTSPSRIMQQTIAAALRDAGRTG